MWGSEPHGSNECCVDTAAAAVVVVVASDDVDGVDVGGTFRETPVCLPFVQTTTYSSRMNEE